VLIRMPSRLLVLVCILLSGCVHRLIPPQKVSIDHQFSEPDQIAIKQAIEAWCAAVNWCPLVEQFSSWPTFRLVDSVSQRDKTDCPNKKCKVAAINYGTYITIARDRYNSEDSNHLSVVVAHEIGHFCDKTHSKTGVMRDLLPADASLVIDREAIRMWEEGCE
jgi:hypothetical protein